MRRYEIELGDATYTGQTASAKEQFEAMHIALRTGLIAAFRQDPSKMAQVAAFGTMSFEDINRLKGLLVDGKVTRNGDDVPVGENLFADNIELFYLLLARAVRENVAGFWTLRPQTEGAAAAEQSH